MILTLTGAPLVIVAILAFVFIIGIIVAIHEAGHFYFAKKAGILCYEFSIGMGPIIYKKQIGETSFNIRAIPIGGFVSMANQDATSDFVKIDEEIGLNYDDEKIVTEIILDESLDCMIRGKVVDFDLEGKDGATLFITIDDDGKDAYFPIDRNAFYVFEKNQRMQITPYERTFDSKSLWQRFITLFAGPLNNLILGFILYLILAFCTGVPNYDSNVIASTTSGYNAYGILFAGDEIIKVGETSVSTWTEFSAALNAEFANYNTTIEITVVRDGVELTKKIEATTYIASIGLSNIQATNDEKDKLEVDGLRVGNIALRYKEDEGDHPIESGDILTSVKIGDGDVIYLGYEDGKTSWGGLAKIFDEINIEDVRFSYYKVSEEKEYSLEECAVLEPYGNEVLNNQRIEKIQMTLGVSVETHFDLIGCIKLAATNFWDDFTLIFNTLALMIHPSDVRQVGVSDLSSFVGIFGLVETYVGAGILPLLSLFAMLTINVGLVNLLPIPALDGGRMVFLLYELITRKKVNKKVETIINNIFFILILILFIYVTYNDIIRVFG